MEVVEPNVLLFQRDFFTVCFSPTLCVPPKHLCIFGAARRTSVRPHVTEAMIQFLADITSHLSLIVAV